MITPGYSTFCPHPGKLEPVPHQMHATGVPGLDTCGMRSNVEAAGLA